MVHSILGSQREISRRLRRYDYRRLPGHRARLGDLRLSISHLRR